MSNDRTAERFAQMTGTKPSTLGADDGFFLCQTTAIAKLLNELENRACDTIADQMLAGDLVKPPAGTTTSVDINGIAGDSERFEVESKDATLIVSDRMTGDTAWRQL